ncbi:MAG: rod shape-determining protein MreD [Planctomycetota bacterium]|jgi:rod shape-determining protein MreD
MRWLTFCILACMVLTLQVACAPRVALWGWRPDWLLIFVIFIAMSGKATHVVAGAWLLGLAADLMTSERLGFLALSYMAVALLVVAVREYLFCLRSTTRFATTFVLSVIVQAAWMLYVGWQYDVEHSMLVRFVAYVVPVSIYTAAWAVPIHGLLDSMTGLLGLAQPKYSHQGLSRMVRHHV